MSVKSSPFYWLECDTCHVSSTEGSDYVAWGDIGGAEDDARDGEWLIADGKHFCAGCIEWCPGCENDLVPTGERCDECRTTVPA